MKLQHSPEYTAYMRSVEWDEKRRAVLKRDGYRCRRCGTDQKTLTVHHRNYDNLGHERLEDLITLCPDCHKDADRRRNFARWKKIRE